MLMIKTYWTNERELGVRKMEQRTAVFNISLVILFDWFFFLTVFYIKKKKIQDYSFPKENCFLKQTLNYSLSPFDVYKMYIVSIKIIKIKCKRNVK